MNHEEINRWLDKLEPVEQFIDTKILPWTVIVIAGYWIIETLLMIARYS